MDKPDTATPRRPSHPADAKAANAIAKPKTCQCPAYRWPHRPGGGLCCWPRSPISTCPTPASTNRPRTTRRRGVRASIMREYGLHPIRDRQLIDRVMPYLYREPGITLERAVSLANRPNRPAWEM